MSGFEDSGLWPPRKKQVIDVIVKRAAKTGIALPQMVTPQEDRFEVSKYGIERLSSNKYIHLLSSPTRKALPSMKVAINEAQLREHHDEKFITDKISRISDLTKRSKRKRVVPPSGAIMNSISVRDIRWAKEIREQEEAYREREKQLKAVDQVTKAMEKDYKDEWNVWKRLDANKELRNGRLCMRTFPDFLRLTSKEDFIPLESSHPLHVPAENLSFLIDAPVKFTPASVQRPFRDLPPPTPDRRDGHPRFIGFDNADLPDLSESDRDSEDARHENLIDSSDDDDFMNLLDDSPTLTRSLPQEEEELPQIPGVPGSVWQRINRDLMPWRAQQTQPPPPHSDDDAFDRSKRLRHEEEGSEK